MLPCKNCFENNWSYEYIEGYIKAICKNCGYEVEFESKKLKKQRLKKKINNGSIT